MELESRERKNISKQKRRSKSISPKRKSIIEDWYVISEVWRAYEIIYEAHTKHGSHLKIDPTYRVLNAGCRRDNMLKDIRDFYFKWQVWEKRTTKQRKNVVIKLIDSSMLKERYQTDTMLL